MTASIKKLLRLLNRNDRKKLIFLFCMMIFAAVLETVGIGLIIPFVGVVTNPSIIQEQAILASIYDLFGFTSNTAFIVFAVVTLLSVYIFKNVYLFMFNYAQVRVILNQQVKLSKRLFKEYLIKPYHFHLQRNTAELLRNVNREVPNVIGIIVAAFQLITEVLVVLFISILLLAVSPLATLTASILLVGSVALFFKIFRQKIMDLGKEQQKLNGEMIKWVNQGLGASKEVKVSGKEQFFIGAYTKKIGKSVKNARYITVLDAVPRLFIETIIVSIVLITLLIIVFQDTGTTTLITTMALFAMAAFRIMPSISRIIALMSGIRYSQPALEVVYDDLFIHEQGQLNQPRDLAAINKGQRNFADAIELQGISFKYPNHMEHAIKNVSLTIPIGQSVAIVGESGAGKTTLTDIILGLFQPEKGNVFVDGKDVKEMKALWQKSIGYIPQSIYLSDDTIRNNVAFGIEEEDIDDEAVWRSLEQAQLKEFMESLPGKLATFVGENGVRLSGGQRQRIGIARALYHNPEILFMDEATSSLDNETEKEIMKAFNNLKGSKTLIIIAHRLSTIENCDTIFRIHKGSLVSTMPKQVKTI